MRQFWRIICPWTLQDNHLLILISFEHFYEIICTFVFWVFFLKIKIVHTKLNRNWRKAKPENRDMKLWKMAANVNVHLEQLHCVEWWWWWAGLVIEAVVSIVVEFLLVSGCKFKVLDIQEHTYVDDTVGDDVGVTWSLLQILLVFNLHTQQYWQCSQWPQHWQISSVDDDDVFGDMMEKGERDNGCL